MISRTLQNGKYRIVRVLGQGGFGITYEGVQTGLNRRVAIKEFFMSDYCERDGGTPRVTVVGTYGNRQMVERFKQKFIKEAQMIAGLDGVKHIIRIYDVFEENNTAYYVMDYIEGGSLRDFVMQRGRLDESTARRYISQVADALSVLHSRRIMHMDIKPDNILLKDGEVVLIDFGISKHYDQWGNATTTTPVGRSKGYAPIEQYQQGGVQSFSPETDIYSMGATLYFLLTAQAPPEATLLVASPISFPSYVSSNMRTAISKAMQPSKNDRPHTVGDFFVELGSMQQKFNNYGDKTVYDDIGSVEIPSVIKNEFRKAENSEQKSYIRIQSDPTGAAVCIDGSWRGITPHIFEITSGKHNIKISKGKNYLKEEKNVDILQGETKEINIQLRRIKSESVFSEQNNSQSDTGRTYTSVQPQRDNSMWNNIGKGWESIVHIVISAFVFLSFVAFILKACS